MSQIFYSEIDAHLQQELNARGRAGVTDRSETALRYMTEKIANVSITAYEGNKRDKNKIVHELGGRTVISGQYQPGGPDGFLTDRTYALKDSRWVINQESLRSAQISGDTGSLKTEQSITENIVTDRSKRTPPFITQASLQINDNSKGTTNKATINITIANPDRDLNYMETIYARPGRYCLVKIEHPDSALMTLSNPDIQGKLTPSSLPNRDLIKDRYPEAETEYEELRKMNKIQFEGLITAFEYSYNQDGTVSMTIYILGTSQTYTDMSMIMQTNITGSNSGSSTTIVSGSSFYNEIYKDVNSLYEINNARKENKPEPLKYYAFGEKKPFSENEPRFYFWNYSSLKLTNPQYITLNWLIDFINTNILTKLKDVVDIPRIYSSYDWSNYTNKYEYLCSADPENVLLLSNASVDNDPNWKFKTDMYGQKRYLTNLAISDNLPYFYNYSLDESEISSEVGYSGNILISMNLIKEIQTAVLNETKNTFTVGKFLEQLSSRISSATGGAINLKLITDPEDLTFLYYRDANWFKTEKKKIYPYDLPMYATHPNGTIVREFKLSSKLPSSAQSLMYSINSTDKVTEDKLGPYISFMYNNGTATRTPRTVKDVNGKDVTIIDETTTYGGGQELSTRLAQEYLALHLKYVDELLKARVEFGLDPTNEQKRANLQVALTKYIQYPKPTIQQTNQVSAPTFPIEAEFTIDGINGLRYGDVLDFPALPSKYKTNTTFTIKGLTHTISTNGEWTTNVSCLMRPKFD